MVSLPLAGVRVLDLTWYTAGPYCTRLLADYGADIIKIERPTLGDPARHIPPFYRDEPGTERSGLFLFLNTNKRSVTVDLKDPRSKRIIEALARDADIIVESFSPRVLPGLGLGYDALSSLNPRLVMTSITSFGQTGPYRDWKGTDLTVYAMGGAMLNTGHPNREPLKSAGYAPSFYVGAAAAVATMTALLDAEATGEGDHLDISFFETWMGSIDRRTAYLLGYQYTGDISTRSGPPASAGSGTWVCADGYFTTTVFPARFSNMARMIGAAQLSNDPQWASPAALSQAERIDEFAAMVQSWMVDRTKAEIREACQASGVIGAPINNVADVVDDPHFRSREFWQSIDHPTTGPLRYPGYTFRLHTEGSVPPRRRAPLLGEHTAEVLCGELGVSIGELEELRSRGVA